MSLTLAAVWNSLQYHLKIVTQLDNYWYNTVSIYCSSSANKRRSGRVYLHRAALIRKRQKRLQTVRPDFETYRSKFIKQTRKQV